MGDSLWGSISQPLTSNLYYLNKSGSLETALCKEGLGLAVFMSCLSKQVVEWPYILGEPGSARQVVAVWRVLVVGREPRK